MLSLAVATIVAGSVLLYAGSENDGSNNVYYGEMAGYSLSSGSSSSANVFIGTSAGYYTTDGYQNIFMGHKSGYNNTIGNSNTFVGYACALEQTNTQKNTFFGSESGRFHTNGNDNVFIGAYSGYHNQDGKSNTFVGTFSGDNSNTSGSVLLGNYAGYAIEKDNVLMIANDDTNASLIYGEFDNRMLRVNGTMEVNSTKIDISGGDETEWAYPALTMTASDLPDDLEWRIGLVSLGSTDTDRGLVFRNQATGQIPFDIVNTAKDELLELDDQSVIVHGEAIDIGTMTTPANLIVGGDILASWSGSNTERDGTKYLVAMSANNSASGKTSDAGFALENKKQDFKWEFRTYEAGEGFTATKALTGGGEFRIENTTDDYHNAKMIVGGVTIFENGQLQTPSSRALKTNIEPLDTKAALDAFHKLQPVSYAYKAHKEEPVVGFIAEDIPELVATKTRTGIDSTEIVAVITKVVQEQDKQLKLQAEKIKKLEAMQKRLAKVESLLTNLALETSKEDQKKLSLNK